MCGIIQVNFDGSSLIVDSWELNLGSKINQSIKLNSAEIKYFSTNGARWYLAIIN